MSVTLRSADGRVRHLAVGRWLGEATAAESDALCRLSGPVLDIGCGPGRHVSALNHSGVPALGIDTSPVAVALAQARGAAAIVRSVFDRVPGAGRWLGAVLLDGNIGIGGDPAGLLRRVAQLLAPGGTVLVETEPGVSLETYTARLERTTGGPATPWFPWAAVGTSGLMRVARGAGLRIEHEWHTEGRCFAVLRR